MIPETSREQLLQALERFDCELRHSDEWAGWEQNENHKFAIEREGKRYPVKKIISMATGVGTDTFSGGQEANNYLKKMNFFVVPLRSEGGEGEAPGEAITREGKTAILGKLREWLQSNSPKIPSELKELREEFVRVFPKESIKDLTLERYALGHERYRDSFCYWLEYKTKALGGVWGGQVRKYGVWWSRDHQRWEWAPAYNSADDALSKIKGGLVSLIAAVDEGRFEELDRIGSEQLGGTGRALRSKPLYLYFPDEFLPITQPQHLGHFLTSFGAQPQGDVLTRNRQLLQLLKAVDAISFAGGSAYGLEAAAGVSAEIRSMRENAGDWGNIVIVPGAIIFDLGPRRFNTIYPDKELGRAAVRSARPGRFPLGAHGAGRFATQGSYFGGFEYRQHSGQGGAFRQVGPTKIAVFTVVNSLGAVVDRQGNVVRCPAPTNPGGCGSIADYLKNAVDRKFPAATASAPSTPATTETVGPTNNTTITIIVTNQKLSYWELQRLAVQVHTSMARAIQPFHTQRDGDTLFAVTTEEVENPNLRSADLGVVASEVAWDAVLSSVPPPPAEGKVVAIDPKLYDAYAGRYEFGPGSVLTVTREGNRLFVEATGGSDVYSFRLKQKEELFPTSDEDFFSRNRRGDRLRFSRDGKNNVSGLTLNPGRWGLPARKIQ